MDIARAGAGANTDATSARITVVVVVVASALVAARARRLRRASRTPEPSRGVIIIVIIIVVVVDPLARSSSRVVVAVVVMVVVVERERRARECRVESRRIRRVESGARVFPPSRRVLFFFLSRVIHQIIYSRAHYERRTRDIVYVDIDAYVYRFIPFGSARVLETSDRRVMIGGCVGVGMGTERFGSVDRPRARTRRR